MYKKSYGLSFVACSNSFMNCSGVYWLLYDSANSLIIFSDLHPKSIMTVEFKRIERGHNLFFLRLKVYLDPFRVQILLFSFPLIFDAP